MNRAKLISTLKEIRSLAEGALNEIDVGVPEGKGKKIGAPQAKRSVRAPGLSFNTNILAFMKNHAAGLSGPKKFTLLLARMTKGNTSHEVSFADLQKQWNKTKVVLGGKFNGAYANRAKASGWVDSPRYRAYTLSDTWKESLSKK